MDEWEGATGGWMGGMEGHVWWGREGWRLYVTLRFRSASRELVCLWLILSGWGGEEVMEGEREREKMIRKSELDREEGGGGVWGFCLTFCFIFFSIVPSPVSDVIQVTYSSQRGSLPPLLLLSFCLSLILPPSLPFSFPPRSADSLNAWMNRPLECYWGRGGGGHRKLWGRRRAREEERMSDKEESEGGCEFPWHLSRYTLTADLILYVWSRCCCLCVDAVCVLQPCFIQWTIYVHILFCRLSSATSSLCHLKLLYRNNIY